MRCSPRVSSQELSCDALKCFPYARFASSCLQRPHQPTAYIEQSTWIRIYSKMPCWLHEQSSMHCARESCSRAHQFGVYALNSDRTLSISNQQKTKCNLKSTFCCCVDHTAPTRMHIPRHPSVAGTNENCTSYLKFVRLVKQQLGLQRLHMLRRPPY